MRCIVRKFTIVFSRRKCGNQSSTGCDRMSQRRLGAPPPESVKVRCMHRTPLHGSGCLTQQSRMRSVAVTLYFTAALLKLLKNFLLAVGVARVTTVQLLSDFLQNTALSPLLRMQP